MEQTILRALKKGDFFTLHPVEYAKERQVWVRGEYDHSSRRYSCYKFSDGDHEHFFSGDRTVYIEFFF